MSFAYVRRYAPFSLAFHMTVSNNAVSVRYAVLGSPSRNQIYILSLYIETHRVSDTYGISEANLILTLRNCGLNKRMHFKAVRCGNTTLVRNASPNNMDNMWEWCLDEYNSNSDRSSSSLNSIADISDTREIINNFKNIKTSRVVRRVGDTNRRENSPSFTNFN